MYLRILFFISFLSIVSSGSLAATLLTNASGMLVGANDVNVGGVLYNVSFEGGSCADQFEGCDEVNDFFSRRKLMRKMLVWRCATRCL